MKRFITSIMVLSLTFILVACSGDSADKDKEKENKDKTTEQTSNEEFDLSEEEKVDEDKVVAHINGAEVTGDAYNLVYVQTKVQVQQAGQDISDLNALKELAMNALINQELLKQDAKEIGIEVSDDEITSELETIKSESKEQFSSFLDQYHLTEEAFKDQLFFAIMHDKYLDSEIPKIEITEKEIQDVYDELKVNNKEIPKLEEVKDQLEQELILRKEQEVLQEKVEELREKAKIETMI